MIRFSSSIRFITRAEWHQLKLNTLPNVMSWDMHMPDQFVPRDKSNTCGISPCLAGGITTITSPQAGKPQGQVAMMHLIPVYHQTGSERSALVRYLKSSAATLLQAAERLSPGKSRLKGCFVGTNDDSGYGLWATVCRGVNEALQAPEWQRVMVYMGLATPTPTSSVSAFIGQAPNALSHIAYDGANDTWYLIASLLDKPNKRWHVARSASTLKQLFKHRYIATDDQVYLGATDTHPLSLESLRGNGRASLDLADPGWAREPYVNRSGMPDLDDAVMMTSVGKVYGMKVLPKDAREMRQGDL